MPVQFLTAEQIAQYGQYKGEPTAAQLSKYFHLDDTDLRILSPWRKNHTRLGFALRLSAVRFLGNFLSDLTTTPSSAIGYLAHQLRIQDPMVWEPYVGSKTQARHRHLIRSYYGYEDFHSSRKTFGLMRRLYAQAWLLEEPPLALFDLATSWLVEQKVLLPGATVLERWIARIVNRTNHRLWTSLAELTDRQQRVQLESLLTSSESSRFSSLERLRREERHASSRTIRSAMRRLEAIRALGLENIDLSPWPTRRVQGLARYGLMAWTQTLSQLEGARRLATLLAATKELGALVQDEVVDLFILLIRDKFKVAKREGWAARMRAAVALDQAVLRMRQVCKMVLDQSFADDELRQLVFQQVSQTKLTADIALVEREAANQPPHFYSHLASHFQALRLFLARFLETIAFDSVPAGRSILSAWDFLRRLDHETPSPSLQDQPRNIFNTPAWRAAILDENRKIDQRYYSFCAAQGLVDALERRDVFLKPSRKYRDQRLQLLSREHWQKLRPQVCAALGRSSDGEKEMKKLFDQLDAAYRQVARRFEKNSAISIQKKADHEQIRLRRLQKTPVRAQLKVLQQTVYDLLPRVDLPELLLEMHTLTGFANEFAHISEGQASTADFPRSLCAVLVAQACNVGIEAVAESDSLALRSSRLRWVQQNYLRDETLTRANARLVAAQAEVPIVQHWGGDDVASADGQRFRVPIEAITAAANWKYFGQGKGITYFTFLSDQFTSFYGVVIPGAVREALYILDGLLQQQTALEPLEVMSDTAGYTDMVFGLFWLLGYQFSPRLRDIGKTRFWRVDPRARYGALHRVARHRIRIQRAIENWDDILRAAGSLKLGHLSASAFMKSLQAGKRTSALAKGIIELGRMAKTLYLLNYIDDAAYRQRILIQLNRGERRHGLARAVFHGHRGELRQNYRTGQEDQLGALGLVVNIIVLWNTLYKNKAIEYLREAGVDVSEEDIARLTPLGFDHIRLIGRYDFMPQKALEDGELRPLRAPEPAQ